MKEGVVGQVSGTISEAFRSQSQKLPTKDKREWLEERKEEAELKYLEFVQFATIQALMHCAILYSYAKERASPLKPGVDIVEEVVKTVVTPVYYRFHIVPVEILKYADRKVADFDRHVPSNVKKVSSEKAYNISKIKG
ncbi:hypothetical protein Fmac_003022 [Flemingia macrophylla]|uniref:Uncharacterized protein n=1 Tax=Flemingia macrophylla TaxID=520843 RepID=A0ABD1NN10_9FABA